MGTIDPLGGVFNIIPGANGLHARMVYGSSITFVVFKIDGSFTITLKESIDNTSEQNLAVIDTVYQCAGSGGTWAKVTQTAAATYVHNDATIDCIAVTVNGSQLSDGFNCVELTATGPPEVIHAVLHGLHSPKAASKLKSIVSP